MDFQTGSQLSRRDWYANYKWTQPDKCCWPQVSQALIKCDRTHKALVYRTASMRPLPVIHLCMWSYNKQEGELIALFLFWLIQCINYWVSSHFNSKVRFFFMKSIHIHIFQNSKTPTSALHFKLLQVMAETLVWCLQAILHLLTFGINPSLRYQSSPLCL